MKVGSLFSGIGGIDLGLERAGMKIAWQVECEHYANRVLEKHWPDVKRFKDIRECGAHNLESIDLICGGFPCQPHSVAGKRKASEDDRDLWGEFARIIREVKPKWVLAENVPGLLSSESGRFFGRVLKDLAESGYNAVWDCIPASAFGAPHQRDRVFIVAHSNSFSRRIQQISESKCESQTEFRNDGKEISLANTYGSRELQQKRGVKKFGERTCDNGKNVSYPNGSRLFEQRRQESDEQEQSAIKCGDWWAIEPDVGRVAHGVSSRVDRLRGLGNAVVPQVIEWIGRRILNLTRKDLNNE